MQEPSSNDDLNNGLLEVLLDVLPILKQLDADKKIVLKDSIALKNNVYLWKSHPGTLPHDITYEKAATEALFASQKLIKSAISELGLELSERNKLGQGINAVIGYWLKRQHGGLDVPEIPYELERSNVEKLALSKEESSAVKEVLNAAGEHNILKLAQTFLSGANLVEFYDRLEAFTVSILTKDPHINTNRTELREYCVAKKLASTEVISEIVQSYEHHVIDVAKDIIAKKASKRQAGL